LLCERHFRERACGGRPVAGPFRHEQRRVPSDVYQCRASESDFAHCHHGLINQKSENRTQKPLTNMASFNKVILAGNLTRDPELRYTPQGRPVAKIGLAVNRRYTLESGEKKEEVSFVDVEAWGQQAETIA